MPQSKLSTTVLSKNLGETLALASALGHKLVGGEVIELVSDLGGGKTTFVKGLAAGLGSLDQVHSPSFTLANQYQADKLRLYHFDFHRLQDAGIMGEQLAEILSDPDNIAVVEWADIVKDILPPERLTIYIKVLSETSRELRLDYPNRLEYLTS